MLNICCISVNLHRITEYGYIMYSRTLNVFFFFAITNYYHYNSVRFSGHSVHSLQIPTKGNRVMFIHTFNLLTKVLCFPLAPPLLSWLPPSCPITSSSSSRCQPTDRSELPDGRSHPRRLLRGRPLRHEGPQPELPH